MFESIKENIIQQCRRYNAECEIKEYYLSQWPADWPFCGYGGIYVILNESEEVIYIGETTDFGRRLSQHFSGDSNNKVKCNHDWLNPYCILAVKLQDNSLRLTIEERLISFYDPMYNKKKVFKAKYQVKTTEQIIPNSSSNNEESRRKISRYRELRKMVDVLRKDVMYKSFIRELIDDCKIGKPEIVFDSSTFEEVLDDEECNHSSMDKRQFDILLVDKNRDAIAICYHPAISPEYPASVDLKRFGLHHCIQLLFMPDDTYRTRPNDGDGRYYYQYRDFLLLLKNTKWFSAKVEDPKTTEKKSKKVPKTRDEIFEELRNKRLLPEDKEKQLKGYLDLFEKAGDIEYIKDKGWYAVCNPGIAQNNIAFWMKKVFVDLLEITKNGGVPWSNIESLILDKEQKIYNSLKTTLNNQYGKAVDRQKADKSMLLDLLKNSNARSEDELFPSKDVFSN